LPIGGATGLQIPDATKTRRLKKETKMSSEREASIDAGISIWGKCGEFSIDEPVWRAWLTLARLHGWTPAGTASPAIDLETGFELDDSEREFLGKVGNDGGYGPPFKGQVITRPDALALAAALERALTDIPDVPEAHLWHQLEPGAMIPDVLARVTPSSSAAEKVGAQKELLKDFITHCRNCSEFGLY
jgi:hypothetical protein